MSWRHLFEDEAKWVLAGSCKQDRRNCGFGFYLQDYQEEMRQSPPAAGQSSGAGGGCKLSTSQHADQQLLSGRSDEQLHVLVWAEEDGSWFQEVKSKHSIIWTGGDHDGLRTTEPTETSGIITSFLQRMSLAWRTNPSELTSLICSQTVTSVDCVNIKYILDP